MATIPEMQNKIHKLPTNLDRLDGIVNGPASGPDSVVNTDSGPVKTVSRLAQEAAADAGTRAAIDGNNVSAYGSAWRSAINVPSNADRRLMGVPFNNKVAFLGDSITSSGIDNDANNIRNTARGMLFWVPTLTRQAFVSSQSLNFGVSGDTTAGALSRVQQVIDSGAGICVVLIGTNDITGPVATTKANLAEIYRRLTQANILTIAMTILPRTAPSTATYGWLNTINRWIEKQESNYPNLRVINASRWFGDPFSLTNSPNPGYTYDGLHPVAIGARYMSKPVADYLLTLKNPKVREISTVTDHYWPGDNETGYMNHNPMLGGTGGSVSGGITGVAADSWNLTTSAGGGDLSGLSITASKNVDAETGMPTQRIEYAGNVTGGWQTIIAMGQWGMPYQEHFVPGDKVEFIVELKAIGSLQALAGITPFLSIQQNGVWKAVYGGSTVVGELWTLDNFHGVIKTPPLTITHALAAGEVARCDIWAYFINTPQTGVAGAFDIISAAVRKVID